MNDSAKQCGSSESQIRMERRLLRALGESSIPGEIRKRIEAKLKQHKFADSDHEVIYRALAIMPGIRSVDDKAALLQAVTRMGFPDVQIEPLFSENPPDENEVMELLSKI
jgi:hypothetical protein